MALTQLTWSAFSLVSTQSLVIGIIVLLLLAVKSSLRPRKMPPGPIPIPFYGNIISDALPHTDYTNLSKTYGDVFSVKLGRHYMVVLNSADVIKEALVKKANDYAGRPKRLLYDILSEKRQNIMFGDYDNNWKFLRKMTHKALRNYVTGENLERLIVDSVFPQLQESIDETDGKPFDPRPVVLSMVSTVIASLCFGRNYAPSDPEFQQVMDMIDNIFHKVGNGLLEDSLPFLKFFPMKRRRELKENADKFANFIQGKIDEHRKDFDPDNLKDFIDNMIKLQQDEAVTDGDEDDQSLFTDVQLRQTINDMFIAGTDTTGNSLYWAIAYMVNYPDVQVKVQEEIDDVIGHDRYPKLSDRQEMPYCDAVIRELMRIKPVAALAITHSTTCNTSIGEYEIPKDTLVTVNLSAAHRSEKYWENPEEFRPERFIDLKTKERKTPDSFMPFSMGRRVCVGEVVAKAELFLIFTGLFQQYRFSAPPGREPPGLDEFCEALVLRCYPYEVVAKKRC
ncbi:steroid 17-alpha-hydroxylase/17,20 lyase-like isoform X1 [Ptychodera flava]|uniref:steroid 17-alpha-hydroxylase/17,20 lyase-like isoform X1 n=1 Tax=Ptychodera flava TaxID=63121 RepID=UPI00396A4239